MKVALISLAALAMITACKESKHKGDPAPAVVSSTTLPQEEVIQRETQTVVNGSLYCNQWLDNLTQTIVPGKTFANVYNEKGAKFFVDMANPLIDQLSRLKVIKEEDGIFWQGKIAAYEKDTLANRAIRTTIILWLSTVKCDFLPTSGSTYDILAGVIKAGYNLSEIK